MRYFPYMVAMSHLSDAQELMTAGYIQDANRRINFAKWVIDKYSDRMEEPFDADAEWEKFTEKF